MANEWNKPALVEFETMLRRHMRRGAAPVAACAGFDLDAASAYLEGALGESHRASYESHLAGCALCRRHLIGLARLAQAAPLVEAQPGTVIDQTPAWARWREVATGWFNFSAWNLKWQIAGATGAAFAILIAALGAQSWRHASNRAAFDFAKASATPPPMAELTAQPLQSTTPESTPQDVASLSAEDLAVNRPAPSLVPVPTPILRTIGKAPEVAIEASSRALAPSSNQPTEAPAAAKPSGGETSQSPPLQTRGFMEVNESSKVSESGLGDLRADPKHSVAKATAPGAPDLPRFQTRLVGGRSGSSSKSPSEKSLSQKALEGVREMIKRPISSVGKLGFNSESEQKETPDTQQASDDESAKLMVWRIRGKVFRFEKDTWVDQEYKPEMQEWRRWTLTRGSDEYKRVLADEPLLKIFFDHGPILIVWKNRIYKVLK